MKAEKKVLGLVIVLACLCGKLAALPWSYQGLDREEPTVYVSITDDPATTMTLSYHTPQKTLLQTIHLRKEKTSEWQIIKPSSKVISPKLRIHHIHLKDLKPDTKYEFKLGAFDRTYAFKTLSKDPVKPLNFVVGGDAYYHLSLYRKMNEAVARKDPAFVVLGGDIAYTVRVRGYKGYYWENHRLETFCKEWSQTMVTSDGRLIPFLIVMGNHDAKEAPPAKPTGKSLLYEFFPAHSTQKTYKVVDLDERVSLIMLDTGHIAPIRGEQTEWLQTILKERKDIPYKITIYHKAAYPSYYSPRGRATKLIRKHWVPLFEENGVFVSFEHDNHTYKRTYPMLRGRVDPQGIVYLGDGSWGVEPRKPKERWYLAKAEKKNAFYFVQLDGKSCSIDSYDIHGDLFEKIIPGEARHKTARESGSRSPAPSGL